jgi:hypothetical protein
MADSIGLQRRNILAKCSLVLSIATLFGCSNIHCCFSYESKDESGSKFFILGLGLVTLPATHGNEDILVANSKSIGLTLSNQPGIKASLGYTNSSVVSVPVKTNSITEVKTCPIDDKSIYVEVFEKN